MTVRAPSMRNLVLTLIVAVVAAGAAGSFAPESIRLPATVAAVAAIVAAATPVLVSRWVTRPLREDLRRANERITAARRDLHEERLGRAALRELDRGLDQAADESEARALIRHALIRHHAERNSELHLIDPVDPVLSLSVSTLEHPRPGERTSPWESLAARTNTTLVYPTTDRLDVCVHIASRLDQPRAVVAVPINATGRLLGVLYVFDQVGTEFRSDEVAELEDIARIIAARIAVMRASTSGGTTDAIDRLTGLPDRAAMQERVIRMLESRQSFTVAVADVDSFKELNDVHGREVGDRALQRVAKVARRAMRPDDSVGRIGGDELLFILPRTDPDDATRALERLREELVLAQSTNDDPTITLSIGVIGSASGGTIEKLLHRAAGALNHAKSNGGNRVVVAQPAPKP